MKNSTGLSLPEYFFNTSHTVIIIGAGLAGCAIAHALAKRGYSCKVYDRHNAIAGATSALPAAVVRPATSGDYFFKSYFDYAFDLVCESLGCQSLGYEPLVENLFTQCGSLELTTSAGNPINEIKNSNSNRETIYNGTHRCEIVDAEKASTLAGAKLDSSAVHIKDAGFVNPQLLCEHWLQHEAIEFHGATSVATLRKTQHGWQLLSDSGSVIDESHIVVLATAEHTDRFDVAAELPLQKAVGQIDLFEHNGSQPQRIINSNGYLLPVDGDVWCGATHRVIQSIGGNKPVRRVLDADSQANKAKAIGILPALSFAASPASSFAAVRTFTPDRLPVVGAVHDGLWYRESYADLKHGKPASHFPEAEFHQGLYLAAGLGSRGATQAMLIGELLSDLISGEQNSTDLRNQLHQNILRALHPARFLIRALRRGS